MRNSMSHRAQKWLNGNITVIYWSSSILLYSIAPFNGATDDLLLRYRARNTSPGVTLIIKLRCLQRGRCGAALSLGAGHRVTAAVARWRGCWGAQQHSHQQQLAVVSTITIHASPEPQFHSGIRNINIRNQHVMTQHLMGIDNINCNSIVISFSYPQSWAITLPWT